MSRLRLSLISALIALVALGGLQALAHEFLGGSRVNIRYGGGAFYGKVGSSEPFCYKWREVRLRKFSGGQYRVVARAKTNRLGEWRIRYPDAIGAFYAQVPYKRVTDTGHVHACRKAESDYKQVDR